MRSFLIASVVLFLTPLLGGCDRILGKDGNQVQRSGPEFSYTLIDSSNSMISDSTTWTRANGPYRVTTEVHVSSGGVLTIEPGVDVLFDTNATVVVFGELRAYGMVTDSVRFLPGDAQGWGGIWLTGYSCVGKATMRYARISGADLPEWQRLENLAIERLQESGIMVKPRVRSGGAGIYANGQRCVLDLAHVVVSNNIAAAERDGHYSEWNGGGVYLADGAKASFSVCTIRSNVAGRGGGVSVVGSTSSAVLDRCLIADNVSRMGGAAFDISGTAMLTRCIVVGNTATNVRGTAIYSRSAIYSCGTLSILNGTVFGNSTLGSGLGAGGAIYVIGITEIANSVIWGNAPGSFAPRQLLSRLDVRYSDIQFDSAAFPGTANLNADPMFTDPVDRDFTPSPYSPLVDAGDPDSPHDPDGSRTDIGAVPAKRVR